jgi:hypothetical protein
MLLASPSVAFSESYPHHQPKSQDIQKLAANSTTYAKIVSLAFGCKNIYLGSWQSVHS